MKFTNKEKKELLSNLEISRNTASSIANSEPPKRKTVWTYTEEEKKELNKRASWLNNLIKKVEQL